MRILGKYPKGHREHIRVNVPLKIRDRIVIGNDLCDGIGYTVIAVGRHRGNIRFSNDFGIIGKDGHTILLDRPLEKATEFHEEIMFDHPARDNV